MGWAIRAQGPVGDPSQRQFSIFESVLRDMLQRETEQESCRYVAVSEAVTRQGEDRRTA